MKAVKIIAVILIHFITSYGIAQNCNFSKDETDKFTNERVLHTKPMNVISEKVKLKKVYTIEKIEMQLKYENKSYLLSLAYHFALGASIANTNDKLILLLADGSIVELPCVQNMPSQERKYSGLVIFSYNFEVSEANFKKLSMSDITDIRMTAQINQVEFPINKEIKTSTLFDCISQNK